MEIIVSHDSSILSINVCIFFRSRDEVVSIVKNKNGQRYGETDVKSYLIHELLINACFLAFLIMLNLKITSVLPDED